jgi:hypothetical protein
MAAARISAPLLLSVSVGDPGDAREQPSQVLMLFVSSINRDITDGKERQISARSV